ncbi:calmodulin-regulated spectrin-associated protein 2-like [Pimephales promelas]|uniref:calmodulin-regulated spectrin-associated protein 2-like n=1 Tax=Pimephales promelas TaxID=90988 RepID=UPI001955C526|nr:calmodulin-regulated spectrin-associated protein 2-like [Pimephales promelas]
MQPRVDVKMGDAAEIKESKRTFIVPTIKSVDHYDFTRAKISCSLTWLIAKAFGSALHLWHTAHTTTESIRSCYITEA